MASPALSRSSSATFAPGPHRRSHPNLQNLHSLSLAPLTPKYPIDPADYDAYYDPTTAELHSSASLSHISGLPSPGGILTNSPARSRNPSRVRKKAKSSVHIREPEKTHHNDHEDEVFDHKPPTSKPAKLHAQLHIPKLYTDPSWLVQTGLSLTESSRETKGQSWISKRDSSTSLANTPVDDFPHGKREGRTPRGGRATPARSRVTSRQSSRNTSRTRRDLSMTMTGISVGTPSASFATAPEVDHEIKEEEEEEVEDIRPDWADPKTQAEMAAHVEAEFEDGWDDGDPYGVLNFEGQGSSDEDDAEQEVRAAMRKWGIGGWMDGAIDALFKIEEEVTAEKVENDEGTERATVEDEDGEDSSGDIETPPEKIKGPWDDLGWFRRVFTKRSNT